MASWDLREAAPLLWLLWLPEGPVMMGLLPGMSCACHHVHSLVSFRVCFGAQQQSLLLLLQAVHACM